MRYSVELLLGAMLLTLPTACQKATPELDVCDAIKQGPQLLGKPVVVTGWSGSGYHWVGLGSSGCEGLLEVQIGNKPPTTVENPQDKHAIEAQKLLEQGLPTFWDFRAKFTGVLTKRSIGDPYAPALEAMPYVLDVTRIDGLRVGRAPWRSRPAPPLDTSKSVS